MRGFARATAEVSGDGCEKRLSCGGGRGVSGCSSRKRDLEAESRRTTPSFHSGLLSAVAPSTSNCLHDKSSPMSNDHTCYLYGAKPRTARWPSKADISPATSPHAPDLIRSTEHLRTVFMWVILHVVKRWRSVNLSLGSHVLNLVAGSPR
jgi:hypothetical protein